MLVLDTDILTLVQHDDEGVVARLRAHAQLEPANPVCVTIVSLEAQMRGWLAWVAKARTPAQLIDAYRRLRLFFEEFQKRPVLDYDAAAAHQLARLQRAKVRLGNMDLRIAAIALAHQATLISRNLRDFRRVPGLVVEDWTS